MTTPSALTQPKKRNNPYMSRDQHVLAMRQIAAMLAKETTYARTFEATHGIDGIADKLTHIRRELEQIGRIFHDATTAMDRRFKANGFDKLTALCANACYSIEDNINLLRAEIQNAESRRVERVNELRGVGLDAQKIDEIIGDFPSEQENRHKQIAALSAERQRLEQFMREAKLYPEQAAKLLKGTRFEHWQPQTEQAAA